MAFCANCGTAWSEGAGFCANCGKPVGTTTYTAATQATQPVLSPSAPTNSGLASNLAGALAYVLGFISGVVFLVLEPYRRDRFVRFHAMQSILFSVACIVFSIAWSIVWGILFSFSDALVFVDLPLRLLISLGLFLLWLFVMFQAYGKREYHIPFIGALAEKHAG